MEALKSLARAIWAHTVIKEGVLIVVSAVAITTAQQGLALANALEVTDAPVESLRLWANSAVVAIAVTGIKQASAYILARLAGSKL